MKKNQLLISNFILLFFLQIFNTPGYAQTNPVAQPIPYSQNFSALLATSIVYPDGWQGWSLAAGSSAAFRLTAAVSDLGLTASGTAATTAGGIHNYSGKIGMLASGSIDPSLCLAIITTGVFNVQVNYDIMTIRNPKDISNTRINQVDLQYRIGTSGNFISVSGLANGIYQNNSTNQVGAVTTPQFSLSKIAILPAACNNQPIVQIRWVQRDFTGTGSRPSFALDNLVICTSLSTPTIAITGPTAFCSGGTATYTASISNGGTAPIYSWKKNGLSIGANNSTIALTGLTLGDQITCVLTSSLGCLSGNVITSNTITIGVVNSSPTITSAILTDLSCPGAKNGAIDITISGGTPPYIIAWDTTNTLNGSLFGVTVSSKTPAHPFASFPGFSLAYYIDGIEGKQLSLTKGISYSFSVLTAGHPFHISTDSVGGNILNIVSNGQSGAPTQSGTVLFKPGSTTPSMLYYPCQFHTYMGSRIRINDGFLSEDLSNRSAGTYSVIVTDANGCTTTAQYTLIELPSSLSIAGIVNDATCTNPTGSVDITVTGGQGPYTFSWDTINIQNGANFGVIVGAKTPTNPYFGLGNPLAFYIDGNEAPDLFLTSGVSYDFTIFNPGHPWHISTDFIGGNSLNMVSNGQFGAPADNGTVTFLPNSNHPSSLNYVCANHQYMGGNILIQNAYAVEDPTNLQPGTYTVTATDIFGCNSSETFTIEAPSICTITLNLKGWIEGYYSSGLGQMVPALANQGIIAGVNECDTIFVELHDQTTPGTIIASTNTILSTNGQAVAQFPGALTGGSYFIVIKQRNAIQTWSSLPVSLSAVTGYDFSISASQAFGNNLKQVDPNVWAFYSGDITLQDEFIDASDMAIVDNDASAFAFGYFTTDVNGDGFVDASDMAFIDNNATLFIFSAHP